MSSAAPSSDPKLTPKPASRKRLWARHGLPSLVFSLLLAACVGTVLYVLIGRPVSAPDWLRAEVEARVAATMDQATVRFDTLDFVLEDARSPRVRMSNVQIMSASGAEIVGFAEMRAGLSLPALLTGQMRVTTLSLSGVFANLRRLEDGSVTLSGGFDLGAPAQRAPDFGALIEQVDAVLLQEGFEALQTAEVQALTLRLEDVRSGRAWTVDGARVSAARTGDTLRLSSDLALLSGGTNVATLEANYDSAIGSRAARFGLTMTDVAAADIAALAAPFAFLDVLRAPISGSMRGGVEASGDVTPVSVTFSIGAGVVQPTDATRPIPFQSAQSYFTYDPSEQVMAFDAVSVESDWISASVEGQSVLGFDAGGVLQDIVGQFRASTLAFNPAGFYDTPIALDAADMDFRLQLNPFRLQVGQAYFEDQGQALVARGTLDVKPDGWHYGIDAQMDGVGKDRLFALWPEQVVPKARTWVQANLIRAELSNLDLAVRATPQDKVDAYFSFDFDDTELRFLKTMPPITGGRGSASMLDDRFVVTLTQGAVTAPEGGDVDVAGTAFIIPDATVKGGAPAVARVQLAGPVHAALSLLDQPPLRVMQRAGIAPDVAAGRVVAEGHIALPLRKGTQLDEITFDATARLSDVDSAALIPGRTLKAAQLTVVADDSAVLISGPGTLDGVPFEATWTQPIGAGPAPSQLRGQLALSQDTLDAFNIGLPPGTVAGAGQGDIVIDLPVGDAAPAFSLTSDLQGLRLSVPALGWVKPEGGQGRLALSGALGAVPRVDRLVLESAGLTAQGSVTLREGGGLERADFPRMQVGGWLDAPVALVGRGAGAAPAIEVRGGTLDLRKARFGNSRGTGSAQSGAGPLSLRLDRLQITDTIALADMRGAFTLSGGLDGTFTAQVNGGTGIEGRVIPQNGRSAVRILSQDAGGVFASAGLLRQARSGDLSLSLLPVGEASFDGALTVTNTRVQDAPAIAALLNALSIVGLLEQMGGSGIHFQEVEARFRLSPSMMTLTEASAVGPSMGLSMDGRYDVNAKVLDMQGVVSPLYLLNGIGSLFTRKGEGVIGFNYRLQGPAQNPNVSVNPLSALTPGFLREIFRRPAPTLDEAAE